MKLPPASRKPSYTDRLSSLSAPHPSIPNVIAPSASSDTRSPLLPSSWYFIPMAFPSQTIWPRPHSELLGGRRANRRPSQLDCRSEQWLLFRHVDRHHR